jgi:apolipoprotein N-acyltransferase
MNSVNNTKPPNLLDRLTLALFSSSPTPKIHVPWPLRFLFACVGGTCVFLAFPNFNQFYLAYFALALELWAVEGLSPRKSFFMGWLAGSITNIGGFYWVGSLLEDFGHMPFWLSTLLCTGLGIVQGLVYALWAWGVNKINAKSIWVAGCALFVAIEAFFPMLFPWYYANSQYNFIPAIQTADILGVLGVTFLLTICNVLIFDVTRTLWLRRRDKTVRFNRVMIGLSLGYIAFAFIYAPIRIAQIDAIEADAPKLMVGMVEADVGIWEKEPPEKMRNNLFIHHTLSHKLSEEGVDLLVWPESAYQQGLLWGSRKVTDNPLDHELDSLYAPWFQPTAHLIYSAIDSGFGENFHRNPAIHYSMMQALMQAAEEQGLRTLEPFNKSLVKGIPVRCSEQKPFITRCPYTRLAPDDLTYDLPSAEPLRSSRKADLDKQIRPEDFSSPIRDFDAAVIFGTLTLGTASDKEFDFDRLYKASGTERKLFNTAIMLEKDGRVIGNYHKNYLLMFGEYIPYADKIPWVYDILPEAGNLTRGDEIKTLSLRGYSLGPIICYEDILPRYVRELSKLNPHVLVNMTNDAWFGKTAEPMLHLALAMMRTVEHRKWLIRSTNTGVSAFVDPNGRMVQHTSIHEPEILRQSVAMMPPSRTIYSYIGDILGWLALAWVAFLSFLRVRDSRRNRKSSEKVVPNATDQGKPAEPPASEAPEAAAEAVNSQPAS